MIGELLSEQRLLFVAGGASLAGAVVCGALSLIDPHEILGISRWIKPMKFFASLAIFLWTMMFYLHFLVAGDSLKRWLATAFVVLLGFEMVAIIGQALRGTTSHFNVSSAFDGAVFSLMGMAIALLTLLVALIAVLYFVRDVDLPPAVVWGMRLGLAIFLIGSVQGGYMAAYGSHSVGVADGGAGLPIVNWSTEGGDLRIAHFLGLHGLQAIPIIALIVELLRVPGRVAVTIAAAAIYLGITLLLFANAMAGRPLAGSNTMVKESEGRGHSNSRASKQWPNTSSKES